MTRLGYERIFETNLFISAEVDICERYRADYPSFKLRHYDSYIKIHTSRKIVNDDVTFIYFGFNLKLNLRLKKALN